MIVGNSMNAAALAAERLAGEMAARRATRASMIPMLNSLMVVGIVALPGMMTGQVHAGASPLTAVRYQILVMFMLLGAVAMTGTGATLWYLGSPSRHGSLS